MKVAEARFAALDLLRGLAAIAVLLVHFRYGPTGVTLAQKGYLAVDFFFVLSGFVVAHAYEQRLRRGTWLGPFCLTRLLRLYPLYAFASIIGIAAVYFQPGTDRDTGHWAVSILLAVFFLPTPSQFSANPGSLYPFNFAAWSLFWELAVNLLYGVAAPQLDKRLLSLLIALGAAGVAVICLSGHSLDGGANWPGLLFGTARALFGFFAGAAVFRLHQRRSAPIVPAWLLGCVLILTLSLPLDLAGPLYDLLCVTCLFPMLVWLGAKATAGPALRSVSLTMGYISYGMYVLHTPILDLVHALRVRTGLEVHAPAPLALAGYLISLGTIAWMITRFLDAPTRSWLVRSLTRNKPAPASQSAP
ncbi:MAG TPA: acyltransferase [Sphingomicrobium sp.]|nr:acyltransferase [Sphingomicrobium sp.]